MWTQLEFAENTMGIQWESKAINETSLWTIHWKIKENFMRIQWYFIEISVGRRGNFSGESSWNPHWFLIAFVIGFSLVAHRIRTSAPKLAGLKHVKKQSSDKLVNGHVFNSARWLRMVGSQIRRDLFFFLKNVVPFTHILRTNTYHESITATMKNPATAAAWLRLRVRAECTSGYGSGRRLRDTAIAFDTVKQMGIVQIKYTTYGRKKVVLS